MPKPIGFLSESPNHKAPFYSIRYNHANAYMSNKPLGLQVLIDFLGSMMWINIDQQWIL